MLAVLCIFLAIACGYDYIKGRIPNLLILIMFGVGWSYSAICVGRHEAISFLVESVCVMLLLYPIFKIGALGAGDVKLYGICAGYLPRDKFLFFLFLSLLFAALISLIKMIKECNAMERISYLCEYVCDVVQSGNFRLYIENEKERRASSICLAGPIFCSVLLCLGGVY